MNTALPSYPFDPDRQIGSVTEVTPSTVKANLPNAALPEGQWLHGARLGGGEVGEFVLVDCGELALFGRVMSVRLPERERLTIEPELGRDVEAHPVGTIQLLTSVELASAKVIAGIPTYPRIGTKVYSASPGLVKWIAEASQVTEKKTPITLQVAALSSSPSTTIAITPERLFGRHCAILGATGGGKSWSIAKLLEEATKYSAKCILLDPTGEFSTFTNNTRHIYLGSGDAAPAASEEVVLPYSDLVENDLFAVFRPSGQVQVPKLRAAMKSLKLAKLVPGLAPQGFITKANQPKARYNTAYEQHAAALESPRADFDIRQLALQVFEECIWPNGGTNQNPDPTRWGNANELEKSYCVSLLSRIEDIGQSGQTACVFQPGTKPSVLTRISEFIASPDNALLRISLKYVPFSYSLREIVVNTIGRYLLSLGRSGTFRTKPLIVFLDEAHQFLNKAMEDDFVKYPLDAFELVAKEGRKFSLVLCLSTQRPRDIPEGILSQIGTLLVHRLTNDRDREVVERASGDIDKSAAAFLPTLAPGESILIGVDFPMPLTLQMQIPAAKPDSRGPDFQGVWEPNIP